MFYFIPSWYNENRIWYSSINASYQPSAHINFDDGVSLLRMFQNSDQQTMLVIFNYSPYLRSFLYSQQLTNNYNYNLFDEIQNLSNQPQQNLSIYDLDFPQNAELYYTPYLINVYVNHQLYAQVNFTHWSDICTVTYFKDDLKKQKHVFDDRGFISSVIYYDKGIENYQDYLDNTGKWVIREYLSNNNQKVYVNLNAKTKFAKTAYKNMTELVSEKVNEFLNKTAQNKNAIFVVSANDQHDSFFEPIKDSASVIFSLFGNRYPLDNVDKIERILSRTPFFVVDSIQRLQNYSQSLSEANLPAFFEIPPYNTQLKLGHSQRKKEQIIYINFDTIPEESLFEVFYRIFELMFYNEWYDLVVGTNIDEYAKLEQMKSVVQDVLAHHSNWQEKLKFVDKDNVNKDIVVGGVKPPRPRIDFVINRNELDLIANLKYIRVLVDLGTPADIVTQITALSVGIPQINLYESPYVKHMENGHVLSEISHITVAIEYYFKNLKYWNEALVHTVSRLEAYASGEIVRHWINAISELEKVDEKD